VCRRPASPRGGRPQQASPARAPHQQSHVKAVSLGSKASTGARELGLVEEGHHTPALPRATHAVAAAAWSPGATSGGTARVAKSSMGTLQHSPQRRQKTTR
jgi:hypothetical protein